MAVFQNCATDMCCRGENDGGAAEPEANQPDNNNNMIVVENAEDVRRSSGSLTCVMQHACQVFDARALQCFD